MNKKLIRLTESDLHRIVKESVRRVLKETAYDINSPEYKHLYDSGIKDMRGDEDNPDMEYEPYAEKFLNTPNASQNFKEFPRQSVKRDLDFDPLSNKGMRRHYDQKRLDKIRNKKYVEDRYDEALKGLMRLHIAQQFGQDPRTLSKEEVVDLYDGYMNERGRAAERTRELNALDNELF